jgi:hypothetical protein
MISFHELQSQLAAVAASTVWDIENVVHFESRHECA